MKSFWDRTEGTIGMTLLSLSAILGSVGLSSVAPVALHGLFEALGPVAGCGILTAGMGSFLYGITNKRFLRMASVRFKSSMRALTGKLFVIHPIAVVREFISDRRKILATIQTQIQKLEDPIDRLRDLVHVKKVELSKAEAKVRRHNREDEVTFATLVRTVERRKKSVANYEHMLLKLEILHRTLSKMQGLALSIVDDTNDAIQELDLHFQASTLTRNVLRSSPPVTDEGGDAWELLEQEVETIRQNFLERISGVEEFLRISDEFTSQLDLQGGTIQDSSLALLESWEKLADSLLLPEEDKRKARAVANDLDHHIAAPPLRFPARSRRSS